MGRKNIEGIIFRPGWDGTVAFSICCYPYSIPDGIYV
jgi:hypothetical protein